MYCDYGVQMKNCDYAVLVTWWFLNEVFMKWFFRTTWNSVFKPCGFSSEIGVQMMYCDWWLVFRAKTRLLCWFWYFVLVTWWFLNEVLMRFLVTILQRFLWNWCTDDVFWLVVSIPQKDKVTIIMQPRLL